MRSRTYGRIGFSGFVAAVIMCSAPFLRVTWADQKSDDLARLNKERDELLRQIDVEQRALIKANPTLAESVRLQEKYDTQPLARAALDEADQCAFSHKKLGATGNSPLYLLNTIAEMIRGPSDAEYVHDAVLTDKWLSDQLGKALAKQFPDFDINASKDPKTLWETIKNRLPREFDAIEYDLSELPKKLNCPASVVQSYALDEDRKLRTRIYSDYQENHISEHFNALVKQLDDVQKQIRDITGSH